MSTDFTPETERKRLQFLVWLSHLASLPFSYFGSLGIPTAGSAEQAVQPFGIWQAIDQKGSEKEGFVSRLVHGWMVSAGVLMLAAVRVQRVFVAGLKRQSEKPI